MQWQCWCDLGLAVLRHSKFIVQRQITPNSTTTKCCNKKSAILKVLFALLPCTRNTIRNSFLRLWSHHQQGLIQGEGVRELLRSFSTNHRNLMTLLLICAELLESDEDEEVSNQVCACVCGIGQFIFGVMYLQQSSYHSLPHTIKLPPDPQWL